MVFPLKSKKIQTSLIVYIAVAPILVLILFPVVVMLVTSLKVKAATITFPPTWIPKPIVLKNYITMFKAIPLARLFLNTSIIAGGTTILVLLSAMPAAYSLVRFDIRGRSLIMFTILITQMFAPATMLIALYKVISRLGLIDSYFILIVVDAAFILPFCIWLLVSFLRKIPSEIFDAALIDGASDIKTAFKIVIPITKPGIVTMVIYAFIFAWNEFIFAMTLLTSYNKRVLNIGIFAFAGKWDVQWNYLLGAAFLSTIPILMLFLIIEKHLAKGITAGAIK
jgi:multiple sugar transport system permease protein